jgi:hypothetical protein
VVQQALQGHPVGAVPLQLTSLGAAVRADGDANTVLHQVAEQAAHRPLPRELFKHQPDDALGLLVGVEDEGSRRPLDVANRGMVVDLALAGLIEQAVVHAASQQMQFRLAHGPLVTCLVIHKLSFSPVRRSE